jgi:hypothetical protein
MYSSGPEVARSKAWAGGARLLRLWVRILLGTWMSVSCERCVLSGRGLCIGLITRPEESYRLRRVHLVLSGKPVRGNHNPELSRRSTAMEEGVIHLHVTRGASVI